MYRLCGSPIAEADTNIGPIGQAPSKPILTPVSNASDQCKLDNIPTFREGPLAS
jgi:hypothetical protein